MTFSSFVACGVNQRIRLQSGDKSNSVLVAAHPSSHLTRTSTMSCVLNVGQSHEKFKMRIFRFFLQGGVYYRSGKTDNDATEYFFNGISPQQTDTCLMLGRDQTVEVKVDDGVSVDGISTLVFFAFLAFLTWFSLSTEVVRAREVANKVSSSNTTIEARAIGTTSDRLRNSGESVRQSPASLYHK